MAIKTYRPVTPSRRFTTTTVNDDLTTNRPYKPLTEPKQRTGGRRNSGDLTIWHHGGGHKRKLRIIDFKRDKFGIPATVASIEYDPNRSARIALLNYADGEKRYIVYPVGLQVGAKIVSGPEADILVGNAVTLSLVLFATQILVPSKATPSGLLPTVYVPTTAPVLASNLVTLPLPPVVTQMLVPSKATPYGPLLLPSEYVPTTAPLLASNLVTLPLPVLATQILVPSKATPSGPLPTEYVPTTAPVLASNLVTELLLILVTQMLVPSKAKIG